MLSLFVGQSLTFRAVGPPSTELASWSCYHPSAKLDVHGDGTATVTGLRPGQAVVVVTHGMQVVSLNLTIADVPLRLEIVPAAPPNSFAWWSLPQSLAAYANREVLDDLLKPPAYRGMDGSSPMAYA